MKKSTIHYSILRAIRLYSIKMCAARTAVYSTADKNDDVDSVVLTGALSPLPARSAHAHLKTEQ